MQSPGGVPEVLDEVRGGSSVLFWSVVGTVSAMLQWFLFLMFWELFMGRLFLGSSIEKGDGRPYQWGIVAVSVSSWGSAGDWQCFFDRELEPGCCRILPGGRSGAAAHGLWSSGAAILQGGC